MNSQDDPGPLSNPLDNKIERVDEYVIKCCFMMTK
uniref:Uncharacterized protein n=1 Tax=Tetranychus urticae TaxID=32264 RepID=T1K8Z6_TETUR